MNTILEAFLDALLAGLLAENGLLNNTRQLDDLETVLEYERWRIAFMAGKAQLTTVHGEVITRTTVTQQRRARDRRLDLLWKLRYYGRS